MTLDRGSQVNAWLATNLNPRLVFSFEGLLLASVAAGLARSARRRGADLSIHSEIGTCRRLGATALKPGLASNPQLYHAGQRHAGGRRVVRHQPGVVRLSRRAGQQVQQVGYGRAIQRHKGLV
jgi:hypothetical protein